MATERPEDLDRRFVRQKRAITLSGLVLSAAWTAMGVWVFSRYGFAEGSPHLNDIGDFLAGIFAPLAFVWLVVGYFLQGAELSLNTKALSLQVSEMKESVRQQGEQAAALVRSEAHSRRDVLIRVIDFHLDLLSSYACDLWRLAGDVGQETLVECWDRYSKGDKDVFFVSLASALREADAGQAMEAGWRKSAETVQHFRKLCEEYVRIYDVFVEELAATDENKVLHDIYSSGDMRDLRALVDGFRNKG